MSKLAQARFTAQQVTQMNNQLQDDTFGSICTLAKISPKATIHDDNLSKDI